jgi:two-component system nitrogen regulation response regulator GlnG
MTTARILIVDDDLALLQALPEALQLRMGGLTVDTADSAAAALDRIAAQDYNAIVTDIKMPGMDGFALLAEIQARRPDTPTLMITGHGERALAVKALRRGACDFVQKPIDRDYFVASLARAIQMNELSRHLRQQQLALERRASDLERTVEERTRELQEANTVIQSPLRWLLAPSQQLAKVVQQIKQVADSPLTILIEGETGTGKELVARTIHQLSARHEQSFITIDCGAKADPLIASQILRDEQGAGTGAQQRTEGPFQLAEGGSVFLDEIVNVPLPTQSTLLRALEERGDVRAIAASSVPLEREVQAGRFRQDLSDALNEFVIALPPLRERDDILHLANDFVVEASMEFGRPCREISEAAAQVLLHHVWPGNVRELRNVIRRATLLASGVIEREHLSLLDGSRAMTRRSGPTSIGPSLKDIAEAAAADAERQAIRQALQASKGNKTEAARRLRTDYKTLHLKIKQHGIDAGRFRNSRAS